MARARARRSVATGVLLGSLLLAGCAGWHTESVAPRELLKDKRVPAVRVTRADKSKVEIWGPALVGDSIVGHPTELAIARVVMPLSEVQSIATRRTSLKKTLLISLGVIGAVAVYGLLMELNQVQ